MTSTTEEKTEILITILKKGKQVKFKSSTITSKADAWGEMKQKKKTNRNHDDAQELLEYVGSSLEK